MGPSAAEMKPPRRSLLQSSPPALSSWTGTVADLACAFENRQSRSGDNRRRFCETNPIFLALQTTT